MPKYWVKNYLAHGRFPEVGQKQKTEEKERGAKVGENNGQATHGARKPPGPMYIVNQLPYIFRGEDPSTDRSCEVIN